MDLKDLKKFDLIKYKFIVKNEGGLVEITDTDYICISERTERATYFFSIDDIVEKERNMYRWFVEKCDEKYFEILEYHGNLNFPETISDDIRFLSGGKENIHDIIKNIKLHETSRTICYNAAIKTVYRLNSL